MKKIYLILISFLLISCSFNQTFSNREEDKKDAEEISQKFFWELKYGGNLDTIYNLFGDKFFEVTDKEKLLQIINTTQNDIGRVEEYDLVKWETLIIKGSNAKSEYLLVYNVKRGMAKTEETFSMEKDKNGDIKIVGYRVNQDLLNK
ncbi:hypothetical protein EG346_10815 [Chryseobacterium carnipullorum]|uniref:DUF4019 domain-containing protein n=1 Tax=Chryseobacterium carnipullorum TaxID=1124835 RepID=A0A1M7HVN9_CHRCU|nr:hypothetical protein [Chryseobacterium carnipullorum]AZA48642.1 hypothetical protein EG346_10815 [Chryseobacterium carnipullorum]SHM32582.1 hypothetical protein SAMN05444360_110147 [Chryseobacterium carnipullorum]STC92816.1 Uncharacterised protein [Chryseobacterium carnipullorum]